MPSINRVLLAGHLTRDVELRHTQGGSALGKAGLAINRKFKSKDGSTTEEVCFVDLTAWGKTAELMSEHLRKGSSVLVEGRLTMERWEDNKGSGEWRTKLSVTVESCHFLDGQKKREGGDSHEKARRTMKDLEDREEAPPRKRAPAREQDYGETPF